MVSELVACLDGGAVDFGGHLTCVGKRLDGLIGEAECFCVLYDFFGCLAAGSTLTNLVATEPTARLQQAIDQTIKAMELKGLLQNQRERTRTIAKLRQISKEKDIFNPIQAQEFIDSRRSNGTKNSCTNIYNHFCTTNQIPYDPKYHDYQPPIPLIPSTENVNIIIKSANQRFYTPFAIMAEIAVEGEELHKTPKQQINEKEGIISIIGVKKHDNGAYKLSDEIAENLRQYLAKYQNEHPFPTPRQLGEAFNRLRNKRAKELNKPELLQIKLKLLRNYAGAIFYLTKGKDPIQTMQFMRHKKLQTTLHYLRAIKTFTAKARYITKTIKLGQPDTIEKITELSNTGFEKYNEADGYQFFRILQY